MQLVPDGTFRKVRNNIDRLFDKNLTDLIRGIRNNKENEARYIATCTEEIKSELRQDSIFVKANAIEKLSYLHMLGYNITWASFNIIEVMASTRYSEKRIGYLAAAQAFNDETEVLMLTTNLIRKDLLSSNIYDVGVALSGLSNFATTDLSRDLVNDVVNLLSSSRPYVRKKAILLIYKIFLKYPESLKPTFPRLRERLEDQDPGVQSTAVNVICELARKNPRNYLGLQNVFFKLLNTSSNNWMLIKIIKLFGSLVPHEPKLGRKLLGPLTNLINSTSAMSLLYECINTVIAILISISSEGPGDYTPSIQLCVQKLGVLIEDSDQNLKYLGLLAMGRILQTHPKAVQAHKDIVLRCLDDKDESIRMRALDLLYGMVSKRNIMEIVRKLMEHVDAAEGSFYRDELLQRIIVICSHDNYKYITNFEWYISVLVELTKVEGTKHGVLIAEQIRDVAVRVQSIRHFAVAQMALLVENAQLLLQGNGTLRDNVAEVLLAAAWICGEFAQHVNDITTVLDAMLRIKLTVITGALLSVYVQNIAKLYAFQLCKFEADDDWDAVESLDNLLSSKLPEFQYTEHLEAQERACNLMELLRFIIGEHSQNKKVGGLLASHFEGELNPVATKAQKKVPIPEGLNLDEWINEPEPLSDEVEDENEAEESDTDESVGRVLSPADGVRKFNYGEQNLPQHGHCRQNEQHLHRKSSPTSYHQQSNSNGISFATKNGHKGGKVRRLSQEEAVSAEELQRRRKFEQENNPFYVKDSAKKRPAKIAESASKGSFTATINQPEQIQSPLEIAGVIGLEKYILQQGSTINWTDAARKKGKKVGEKKKTGKGKKRTANKRGSESEMFASISDGERTGVEEDEVAAEEDHVFRGDGEMPEGALSDSADEQKNDDEFRALDVDLDEALREHEARQQQYSRPFYSASGAELIAHLGVVEEGGKKLPKKKEKKQKVVNEKELGEVEGDAAPAQAMKKKKRLKKKQNTALASEEGDQPAVVASRKKKLLSKKHDNSRDDYTSIESPVPNNNNTSEAGIREESLISLVDEEGLDDVPSCSSALEPNLTKII